MDLIFWPSHIANKVPAIYLDVKDSNCYNNYNNSYMVITLRMVKLQIASTKIRLAPCIFWSVLTVIADNTQNGYVAEGTRNQTTLNHHGYSVTLSKKD